MHRVKKQKKRWKSRYFFNSAKVSSKIKIFTIISAFVLALVLLVAAYGKLFYPSEELYLLDYIASIVEIILLANLILYRNQAQMWQIASFVFAGWGGYSLFWYQVELPCSCMGVSLNLPNGLSLILNGLFYILSMTIVCLLRKSCKRLWISLCGALAIGIVGFFFANWIYSHFVLTNV